MLATMFLMGAIVGMAQTNVTLRIDAQKKYQHITGFGGFVCSPQFTYGHMSDAEIGKVWGKNSTVGCNIMRLYIPIGESNWWQSVSTAQKAKNMGLIVFASPWGQPAEWKTNGTINAMNEDGTLGYLKPEYWEAYAEYLEKYVQYMRQNGVELDAISIQNEPDWHASYAGCMWSASDIAEFVKTYGKNISCKVMAPETLSANDNYANALNKTDVLACFDIYGAHQYGGIYSAYKDLAQKGKEIWMTEYLINWNENKKETDSDYRNWSFDQDFFNFFTAINTCMLGDFNAWIHYAAKRFYGMVGDGKCGTTNGEVTKRGYIMAHFAKFVTGMTRIEATWKGGALEGSAYLSQTGDTVVAVIANPGSSTDITLDLPFYTQTGVTYTTAKTTWRNLSKSTKNVTETCRPVVNLTAKSVTTILFVRSRDRQPSNMTGTTTRFDRIDDMKTTKTAFGTTYKLSGKTKTFNSSNPLISSRTGTTLGYVALSDRFSQLVMHIDKVTSTNSLTIGAPTLIYVNSQGQVQKHEYERIDLSRGQNFDITLDLSSATLADGCLGLLSFTCDNAVSTLTINFGDVYLANGNNYAAKLTGAYVADDSNVLDYTGDASCTSLTMTDVTELPTELPWLQGTNRVVYVAEDSPIETDNVVKGTVCTTLALAENGGAFRPLTSFTANAASLTVAVQGMRLLMLPFAASVPEGVKVYTLDDNMELQEVTTIEAHQPVLVAAQGDVTFMGSGEVSYATSPLMATLRGVYVQTPLYTGDYILGQQDGQWGFVRQTAASTLPPFGVYAQIPSQETFIPLDMTPTGIDGLATETRSAAEQYYDLQGRQLKAVEARGQVVIIRRADGQVKKVLMK